MPVVVSGAVCICVPEGIVTVPVLAVPVEFVTFVLTADIVWVCVVDVRLSPYEEFPLGNLLSNAENLVNPIGTVEVNSATLFCLIMRSLFEQNIISKYGGRTDVLSSVYKVTL